MTQKETLFRNSLDKNRLSEFVFFLQKVNERTEFQFGLRDSYECPDEPALGQNVEYFGFNILQDDRMRYIIENIVNSDLSDSNKIGNTTISHFYGARGIHSTITGIKDPKLALVDFDRIASGDIDYLENIKLEIQKSKIQKKKFYGTTELHTSIQTAARNFCRKKYSDPTRVASLSDIIEWISGWIESGFMESVLQNATSLEKMYNLLRSHKGIGEYYGYHCSTSNSVNPRLSYQHDEKFCVPGPGAKDTLNYLFPNWSGKYPYGEMVVWLRENEQEFFRENVIIHPFFHNFEVKGKPVFADQQDTMKVYGTEVACCQFGVFRHLKANPHLISKRSVARNEEPEVKTSGLDSLFE